MIHQYKLNGYNIVLDVYSGSVHLVDEVAYDMIALFENTDHEEIIAQMLAKYGHLEDVNEQELRDCLEDIQALKAAGVHGAIIGKAYYTGAIDLAQAVKLGEGE